MLTVWPFLFSCRPDHCCRAEGRGNTSICWAQCKQTGFMTQSTLFYSRSLCPQHPLQPSPQGHLVPRRWDEGREIWTCFHLLVFFKCFKSHPLWKGLGVQLGSPPGGEAYCLPFAACHLQHATCPMPLASRFLLHLSTNHHISFFPFLSRDSNLCPVLIYL